ncbi:MAG: hypothetical protein KAG53_05840 [Endozoicomonadaceae bacterium]|nr:hypothetical protein [Endozoicomonadaceae bacterium]
MAKIVINENMINNDITWNNLKELESCHNKMTRYRIHRVVMKEGREVGVIKEAVFFDEVISFLPSFPSQTVGVLSMNSKMGVSGTLERISLGEF